MTISTEHFEGFLSLFKVHNEPLYAEAVLKAPLLLIVVIVSFLL